jgi:hypothetical protein
MQFTSDVMTNGLTLPSLPVSQDADPIDAYDCRRPNDVPHFRCRGCDKESGITSGTLFASHKLPLRDYLAAIAVYCNEVKGKSMPAMSLGAALQVAFCATNCARQ